MQQPREPDWSREYRRPFSWEPSKALIASIRDYQRARAKSGLIAGLQRRSAVFRHRFWSIVTGADIPVTTSIGGGLVLPHPNGIVVHPDSVIGPNCMLFQQVTLAVGPEGSPTLGVGVDIGAGAKIFGPVKIGDYSRVGANAIVATDVPAYAYAKSPHAQIMTRELPPSEVSETTATPS